VENGKISKVRGYMLAKVHIAANELGLNEADYRATLRWLFNVESAKLLSDFQLDKLLKHFESKGWVPKDKNGKPRKRSTKSTRPEVKPGTDPERAKLINKIEAQLSEIGKYEGRYVPWAYAEAILKKQGGGDYLSWASYDSLLKVVQALSYRLKTLEKKSLGEVHPAAPFDRNRPEQLV
jgi:phage gp16-like protein